MNNVSIFFSYFFVTAVGFIGVAYIHSKHRKDIMKNWMQFLLFSIVVSFSLMILMILTNMSFGWHVVIVIGLLGMVENNIFIPVLMKGIESHITNKMVIATVVLVNTIELGLLYLILS